MNFFLARVWVVTLYLLHQMVGRHLLEKLIPFLDKVPWPVRQKEASQVTLKLVADAARVVLAGAVPSI